MIIIVTFLTFLHLLRLENLLFYSLHSNNIYRIWVFAIQWKSWKAIFKNSVELLSHLFQRNLKLFKKLQKRKKMINSNQIDRRTDKSFTWQLKIQNCTSILSFCLDPRSNNPWQVAAYVVNTHFSFPMNPLSRICLTRKSIFTFVSAYIYYNEFPSNSVTSCNHICQWPFCL